MSDHSSNTVTFVDYGLSGSLDRVTLNLGPVARVVGEEIEGVDGSTSYRGTVEYALARGRVTLDENGSLDLVEVGLGKTFNVGGGKNLSGSRNSKNMIQIPVQFLVAGLNQSRGRG
jgi:hypothetical protein